MHVQCFKSNQHSTNSTRYLFVYILIYFIIATLYTHIYECTYFNYHDFPPPSPSTAIMLDCASSQTSPRVLPDLSCTAVGPFSIVNTICNFDGGAYNITECGE